MKTRLNRFAGCESQSTEDEGIERDSGETDDPSSMDDTDTGHQDQQQSQQQQQQQQSQQQQQQAERPQQQSMTSLAHVMEVSRICRIRLSSEQFQIRSQTASNPLPIRFQVPDSLSKNCWQIIFEVALKLL